MSVVYQAIKVKYFLNAHLVYTLETRAVFADDQQAAGLPADGDIGDRDVAADVKDAVEEGLPTPPLIPHRDPTGVVENEHPEVLSAAFHQLEAEFAVDATRDPDVVNQSVSETVISTSTKKL